MPAFRIYQHHGSYNIETRYTAVRYIVVHYTGSGTSATGSAEANCIYFAGGNRDASAHYFIDDGTIFEYADPWLYATWHCGDGYGVYGITNQNSIGIEVCMNGDNPFTGFERPRLAYLVQQLMKEFGIDADHVVRHYDASRKLCPYYYATRYDEWLELRQYITGGDDMLTQQEIQQIAAAVWEYDWNQTAPGGNTYNALCGIATGKQPGNMAYRNDKLEEGDVYQILRDIRDGVDELKKR